MSTIGQGGNTPPKVTVKAPLATARKTASIVVKSGDTLSKLATQYGVKIDDIYRPGGEEIGNKNLIYAGETLILGKPEENQGADKAGKKENALYSQVMGQLEKAAPKSAKDVFTESSEAIEKTANKQRTAEEARKAAEAAQKAEQPAESTEDTKTAETPKRDEELEQYRTRDEAEARVVASLDQMVAAFGPKFEQGLKGKTSGEIGAALESLNRYLANLEQLASEAGEISPTAAHLVKTELRVAKQQTAQVQTRYDTVLAAEKKSVGDLNGKLDGMTETLNEVDQMTPKDRAAALKDLYANLSKLESSSDLAIGAQAAGKEAIWHLKALTNRKIVEYSNESELDEIDNSCLRSGPGPQFKEHLAKVEKLLTADPQDRAAIRGEFRQLREVVKDFDDPMTKDAAKWVLRSLEGKWFTR